MKGKKGQASVNYLTLLGAILIVLLIAYGVLQKSGAIAVQSSVEESRAYWLKMKPIAIVDYDMMFGKPVFKLKNNALVDLEIVSVKLTPTVNSNTIEYELYPLPNSANLSAGNEMEFFYYGYLHRDAEPYKYCKAPGYLLELGVKITYKRKDTGDVFEEVGQIPLRVICNSRGYHPYHGTGATLAIEHRAS